MRAHIETIVVGVLEAASEISVIIGNVRLVTLAAVEAVLGVGAYYAFTSNAPRMCVAVIMAMFVLALLWSLGWALEGRPFFESSDEAVLTTNDFFGSYSTKVSVLALALGLAVPGVFVGMIYDCAWASMTMFIVVAAIASVVAVLALVFNAIAIAAEQEIGCRGGEELVEQRVYERFLGAL